MAMSRLATPATPTLPGVSVPVATALVVLASVGFGSVPVFVRGLTEGGMAPHAVALYRYALGAVLFLPAMVAARAQWRLLLAGTVAGLAVGLGWIAYVRAIETLPVATVGVVYMTFPVFALIASWALFGEPPTARGLAATGVVAAAAALAAGPAAFGPEASGALFLSFLAPATFGTAIAVLVHLLPPLPVLARMGAISSGSVLGLLPLVVVTPADAVLPADGRALVLVAGIALATALVPQLLYTFFAPVVGAARAATAGAVELPTMMLLGWLALGEAITPLQAVAAAMIAGAVALSPGRKARAPDVAAVTTPRR